MIFIIDWQKSAEFNNCSIDSLKLRFERFPKSHKKIIVICDTCEKIRLIRFHSYNNAKYPNLCSSCSSKGDKNGMFGKDQSGKNSSMYGRTGKLSPNWKGGNIIVICEICGKEFETEPSNICRFCSYKCRGKWHSKNMMGSNNPAWQGGIVNHSYCYKFNDSCRESNRIKYDNECFICNKLESDNLTKSGKLRKLSVHHIDMNKNQGCDDNEWKLVPLCINCHARCHNNLWQSRIEYLLK